MSLLEMPSSVPVLTVPRYVIRQAGEDHPDIQGRLGCTRLVMALQEWDLAIGRGHSRLFPGERDLCYGPPSPKHSDDDDDDDDD